jgi:transcriptional regulator of heat shock response
MAMQDPPHYVRDKDGNVYAASKNDNLIPVKSLKDSFDYTTPAITTGVDTEYMDAILNTAQGSNENLMSAISRKTSKEEIEELIRIVASRTAKETIEDIETKYKDALEIITIQAEKLKLLSKVQSGNDIEKLIDKNVSLEKAVTELQNVIEQQADMIFELRRAVTYLKQNLDAQERIIVDLQVFKETFNSKS